MLGRVPVALGAQLEAGGKHPGGGWAGGGGTPRRGV
jgi:hypothetical protein